MSNSYALVHWNRHKQRYDLAVVLLVVLFIGTYVGVSSVVHHGASSIGPPELLMRAMALAACVLLHIILCIGPLARLSPRFAPLLYNRRHLGVVMSLLALGHAALATLYYGAFGNANPALVVLAGYDSFNSLSGFPFEVLGLGALLIIFVMAATSHDFWLANLSPRLWKRLHSLVYVAYALMVLHVALGTLQSEHNPAFVVLMGLGIIIVSELHRAAARVSRARDRQQAAAAPQGTTQWIDVAAASDIPETRAIIRRLPAGPHGPEREAAIFRHEGALCAISNVCAHQGGPLGEGKIVGGCITCPWHGYQYLPHNGQSPPPFTEKVPTYSVRIVSGRVQINPAPLPPGTPTQPARITPDPSS